MRRDFIKRSSLYFGTYLWHKSLFYVVHIHYRCVYSDGSLTFTSNIKKVMKSLHILQM